MIRRWQREDVEAVAEIEKECFTDAWSEESLLQTFEQSIFSGFVFEEAGEVVGYVGGLYLFEAEVALIAVKRAFQRRGIGRELLLKAIGEGIEKGCEQMFLEVRRSNEPAIALYRSVGFTSLGVRKRYYEDGEDAIVMQLPL